MAEEFLNRIEEISNELAIRLLEPIFLTEKKYSFWKFLIFRQGPVIENREFFDYS